MAVKAFPEKLMVHKAKGDQRVLVNKLPDPREARKADLVALYVQRRHVELDPRHIDTTLGMDILRCRSPEMFEKELWVNLLAYNLIRLLMSQAAIEAGMASRRAVATHHSSQGGAWSRTPGYIVPLAVAHYFSRYLKISSNER